jgi:hypothetical protein
LAEAQQKARVANAELQELKKQSNTFSLKEKQALGVKGRAAHRVQMLQVRAACVWLSAGLYLLSAHSEMHQDTV